MIIFDEQEVCSEKRKREKSREMFASGVSKELGPQRSFRLEEGEAESVSKQEIGRKGEGDPVTRS